MKKLLALFLSVVVVLSACGNEDELEKDLKKENAELKRENEDLKKENDKLKSSLSEFTNKEEQTKKKEENAEKAAARTEFKVGETWEVPGEWKLTVTGAEVSEDRNQFSKDNPAEVIKVTYSYENLGHKKTFQDLFMTPSTCIDEKGEIASTYPISTNPPHPTPIGAKTVDAQEAYGLNNASKTVKIMFEKRDNNNEEHVATFIVPVNK
ncbi:MAG: hypothetical protein Q4A42_02955 [Tissierellia bacterium]|nr:hypothetical protein [Tissierellia bacterium]